MTDIPVRIQKFDNEGNFITKWGTEGTGDGQFYDSDGIAVDSENNVYVTDWGNDRVQKFDNEGNFITKWGTEGTGDGQFDNLDSIAVDSKNNVYVTDDNNDRVQKFDNEGNFITKWGTEGTGDGQFDALSGIAVDSENNVYVTDYEGGEFVYGPARIQKFDNEGNFITKWGTEGTGDGEFRDPNGITIDSGGNVYVADSGNDRIQKFSPSS